jgi:signal transduction histidine kinase
MRLAPEMTLPAVAFLGYWLLAIFVLIRRGIRDGVTQLLTTYLGVSLFWTLSVLLSTAAPPAPLLQWDKVALFAVTGMSIALLLLAQAFLQRWRGALWGLLFGALGLAATFLIDPQISRVLQVGPWQVANRRLDQSDLARITMVLVWSTFTLALLILSWREYRSARSPLHRNRIRYLILAVALIVIGDGLYIMAVSPHAQIAPLVKLGGALAITYATLSHRLPDVKSIYRRSISFTVITLITIGIFLLGFLLPSVLFRTTFGLSTTLGAALVAIVLALGYLPLRQTIQNLIDQFLFGRSYEYDRVLRDYGQRIADILDLKRLTGVVIGVIKESLSIERGALLVAEGGDDGISKVRLKPYAGLGEITDETMEFRGSSPLLINLRLRGLPLTQYDLDFQTSFRNASQQEHAWLRAMNMDVFVPIRAKERLIGVLAVGAKTSGDPYFSADLDLLSTLADQTAVALENARLFEDLVMLNNVLSQAYSALDKANRQLQEMDKLKSAFIGVITHELRTPFANIAFSLQLLERYAQSNLPQEQRDQMEDLATGIQSAKTMVENLVTFSSFLSKQGELRLDELDMGRVIEDTLLPLQTMAEAKGIDFEAAVAEDLPLVYGDAERLGDAVHHLTQNAIKFTDTGGKVSVRSWATADAVHVEVTDTGTGIPEDKLPTLWEDFTQMADPLRRGMEGLGLGLALVKYVVTAHGGQVWAQSEEHVGSTFGFQVPLGGPDGQDAPDLPHTIKLPS